jgi:hypothetical protein
MLPLSAVQATFFETLTPALAPVPVLDQAGPNQLFPYVTIGEMIATEADGLTFQSIPLSLTVHVWSRQPGMLECQQLMTLAKDTLDRKSFPATGFQWVTTIWEYAQTLR